MCLNKLTFILLLIGYALIEDSSAFAQDWLEKCKLPTPSTASFLEFAPPIELDPTCVKRYTLPFININSDCQLLYPSIKSKYQLNQHYCHSKMAQNRDEIWEPGFDVPANFINQWDSSFIAEEFAGTLTPELTQNNDMESLLELNIEAADIWQQMLKCAAGNAEQARHSFLVNNWSCAATSPHLQQKISQYIDNVIFYYSTSHLQQLDLGEDTTLGTFKRLALKTGLFKSVFQFPAFHPLFSQITRQLLAEVYLGVNKMTELEAKLTEEFGENGRLFFQNLSKIGHVLVKNQGRCLPWGLWPSAQRSLQAFFDEKFFILMGNTPAFNQAQYREFDFIGVKHCGPAEFKLPAIYTQEKTDIARRMIAITTLYRDTPLFH